MTNESRSNELVALRFNCFFVAIIFLMVSCFETLEAAESPRLPVLKWQDRSDWVNVRTDVKPGAVGNGQTDDTEAIQSGLNQVGTGSTLYFPPGTYRITETLKLTGPALGVSLIGHGRKTRLVWDGPKGKPLFHDDGIAVSRYVGIAFEGKNRATVGFYHRSMKRFETEVRNQHLAFRNFTEAGVATEKRDKYATAEVMFENCIFENCGRAVSFTRFNDYNYTFAGCEFYRNDVGIFCQHGNFYVRDSHFEENARADIISNPEHGSSIRRCTSVGSQQFLRFTNPVSPMTIQDCHVSGWKSEEGAVSLSGAPVIMFDCVFTNPPEDTTPVRIDRNGQRLILSQNVAEGSKKLVTNAQRGSLYRIPAGKRKGVVRSCHQSFFREKVDVPGKVFDAKTDFGAVGDGKTDDTEPVQKAIDAARKHGKDAIAYLPSGRYAITKTLQITGSDYHVGGTGFRTELAWRGAEGGTMIEIRDPDHITLENIAVGHHDAGKMNNDIDIQQIGNGQRSYMIYDGVFAYGMYQRDPFNKGFRFEGLGRGSTVVMRHVQGNLCFIDCAEATILGNCTYEGSVIAEGGASAKSTRGFLGFMTRLSTVTTHGLYLRDSSTIVMSDFYAEQADSGCVFVGEAGNMAGRATIQGAKVDFHGSKKRGGKGQALDIRNYHGRIFFGHNQFYAGIGAAKVRQRGNNEVELFLIANMFYQAGLDAKTTDAFDLQMVGNECRGKVGGEGEEKRKFTPPDTDDPEVLGELTRPMDDLRRLGEWDLRLNYPHVRGGREE
ncbi:MAG: glycosyl hydrolase family 28-related protein [Candidatus Brocadiia bacterium]